MYKDFNIFDCWINWKWRSFGFGISTYFDNEWQELEINIGFLHIGTTIYYH